MYVGTGTETMGVAEGEEEVSFLLFSEGSIICRRSPKMLGWIFVDSVVDGVFKGKMSSLVVNRVEKRAEIRVVVVVVTVGIDGDCDNCVQAMTMGRRKMLREKTTIVRFRSDLLTIVRIFVCFSF